MSIIGYFLGISFNDWFTIINVISNIVTIGGIIVIPIAIFRYLKNITTDMSKLSRTNNIRFSIYFKTSQEKEKHDIIINAIISNLSNKSIRLAEFGVGYPFVQIIPNSRHELMPNSSYNVNINLSEIIKILCLKDTDFDDRSFSIADLKAINSKIVFYWKDNEDKSYYSDEFNLKDILTVYNSL